MNHQQQQQQMEQQTTFSTQSANQLKKRRNSRWKDEELIALIKRAQECKKKYNSINFSWIAEGLNGRRCQSAKKKYLELVAKNEGLVQQITMESNQSNPTSFKIQAEKKNNNHVQEVQNVKNDEVEWIDSNDDEDDDDDDDAAEEVPNKKKRKLDKVSAEHNSIKTEKIPQVLAPEIFEMVINNHPKVVIIFNHHSMKMTLNSTNKSNDEAIHELEIHYEATQVSNSLIEACLQDEKPFVSGISGVIPFKRPTKKQVFQLKLPQPIDIKSFQRKKFDINPMKNEIDGIVIPSNLFGFEVITFNVWKNQEKKLSIASLLN